jgi:UDP-N-acetylglucosamine 2-epimerase (hydrolysing)
MGMADMKRLLFVTGTRADFGKLKPLMHAVEKSPRFECCVFVTGMHMMARYGLTIEEVRDAGFRTIFPCMNQFAGEPADLVLANTIQGLSRYVSEYHPDLIVVHGDRVETLAGAIVGVLKNILVAHIEGGELSGTVDEILRHAVTKLSHIHFAANNIARERLEQLGELPESIHIIGSPDIDIMLSNTLPSIGQVKERYQIAFADYGILLFHPVTTEKGDLQLRARNVIEAAIESGFSIVAIYPNNDQGCEEILAAYRAFEGCPTLRLFPSMRFEYFLSLLRYARFILGNSSAGIREAPVFPVPSINIGGRQLNRYAHPSIIDAGYSKPEIQAAIQRACTLKGVAPSRHFGNGDSVARFMTALEGDNLWRTPVQKQFADLVITSHRRHPVDAHAAEADYFRFKS